MADQQGRDASLAVLSDAAAPDRLVHITHRQCEVDPSHRTLSLKDRRIPIWSTPPRCWPLVIWGDQPQHAPALELVGVALRIQRRQFRGQDRCAISTSLLSRERRC